MPTSITTLNDRRVTVLTKSDGPPGATGPAGQNATITVFTDQAAFNAYTPAPLELAVLTIA